jgi:hypothetical protein
MFSISGLTAYGRPALNGATTKSGIYDIVVEHHGEPLAYVVFRDGQVVKDGSIVKLDAQVPCRWTAAAHEFLKSHEQDILRLGKGALARPLEPPSRFRDLTSLISHEFS